MKGTDFVNKVSSLSVQKREEVIFDAVLAGEYVKWEWKPITCIAGAFRGTFYAAADYFSIGEPDDFIRMPLTPRLAQKIADHFGWSLPTKLMVNHIWNIADLRADPILGLPPFDESMQTIERFKWHHAAIEARLNKSNPQRDGLLIAGHKKDVVLSNDLVPGKVAIYGWHRLDGRVIQGLNTTSHNDLYADYSHGIRFIRGDMDVNGTSMEVQDVFASSMFSSLLSNEGILRVRRQPGVSNNKETGVQELILKLGSKGELVKDWQTFLNCNGESVTVDGDFGPNTEKATKNYQRLRQLPITGQVSSSALGGITKMNPTTHVLDGISIADAIGMPELIRTNLGTGVIELGGVKAATDFKAMWAPGFREKVWSKRRASPIGIVLHETAGSTASGALQTWRSVVGADFLIDIDGLTLQCADPLKYAPWHAESWSPAFIGIELVAPVTDRCPYGANPGIQWGKPWRDSPRYTPGGPFNNVLTKLGKGIYCPPLPVQLDALCSLVTFLRASIPSLATAKVIDPNSWRLADKTPRPGIVAHAQVSIQKLDGYALLAAVTETIPDIL